MPYHDPPTGPTLPPVVNAYNDPRLASNILRFMAAGNTPTEMVRAYDYIPMSGGGSAMSIPPPLGGNQVVTFPNRPFEPPQRMNTGTQVIDPLSSKPIKPLDNPLGYGPNEAAAVLKDVVPRETTQKKIDDQGRIYFEKERSSGFGGMSAEYGVPFWYNIAAGNALRTTIHNITQKNPDLINLKTAGFQRVRHNATPYDTGRKQIKDMGQQALGVGKGQVRSVSDYINMVNAVTAGQIKGSNELAAQESAAIQQIDIANAQTQQAEETINVQTKNQEKLTNYQIQEKHAQMRQEGIDKGIGAFIQNKAERANYIEKQKAAKLQASTDAMAVSYMAKSMRYEDALSGDGLQSYLTSESEKVDTQLLSEMGSPQDFDSAFMAPRKKEALDKYMEGEKDMDYYKSYEVKIAGIDAEVAAGTKDTEVAQKEKDALVLTLETDRKRNVDAALSPPTDERPGGMLYDYLYNSYVDEYKKRRTSLFDREKHTKEYLQRAEIEKPSMETYLFNLSKTFNLEL